jgi:hypothetical protein
MKKSRGGKEGLRILRGKEKPSILKKLKIGCRESLTEKKRGKGR